MTPILCLIFCIIPWVLVPLAYDYSALPKTLVFHIGVLTCCVALLSRRDIHIPKNALFAALLLLVPSVASSIGKPNPLLTTSELINWTMLVVFMLVVACSDVDIRALFWSVSTCASMVSSIGILQHYGAFSWIPSNEAPAVTFAHRNLLAEYLACALPMPVYLCLSTKSSPCRLISGLMSGLIAVMLVYIRCRSAFLAVVLSAAFAAIVLRRSNAKAFRLLGIALLLFLAVAFLSRPDKPFELMDANAQIRLYQYWPSTLRMIAAHPLGVGPGGWVRENPLYDRGETVKVVGYHTNPHNDYLTIASEYGIAGLFAWMSVLAWAFTQKRKDGQIVAFLSSLVAYCAVSFFGFPKDSPATAMFPFLVIGILLKGGEPRDTPRPT